MLRISEQGSESIYLAEVEGRTKTCPNCGGYGTITGKVTCDTCGGDGKVAFDLLTCPDCGGRGYKMVEKTCPGCNGRR